jgi:hypothetical protein
MSIRRVSAYWLTPIYGANKVGQSAEVR